MSRRLSLLESRLDRLERVVARLQPGAEAQPDAGPASGPVPTVGPSPTVSPAEEVVPERDVGGFEDDLLGSWFPRLGALGLLLGTGFAFKYAIDSGLIGPFVRIMLGVLLGFGLIASGELAERRKWSGYGQAVIGGGIAILYLTIWSAFHLYGMISAGASFGLLAAVTAGGAALALRHDSIALATLATLGGFLNPLAVGRGVIDPLGLYGYTLALDIGVCAVAYFKRWSVLDRVAFGGSWVLYGMAGASGLQALGFSTTIFLLFGTIPYLHALGTRTPTGRPGLTQLVANTVVYALAAIVELESLELVSIPTFILLLSLFHLAQGLVARKAAPRDAYLTLGSLGLACVLFTLWVPLEVESLWVQAAWAGEGVALLLVGRLTRTPAAAGAGMSVLALSLLGSISSLGSDPYSPSRLLFSEQALVLVCQIAAFYVAAVLVPEERKGEWGVPAAAAANLLTLAWLSLEARAAIERSGAADPERTVAFAYSAIWGLYAAGLLAVGVGTRARWARMLAAAIFAGTIAKLVLHDLWLVEPLQRILSFAGLGALLLLCSLLYHRFKELLLGLPTEGEA